MEFLHTLAAIRSPFFNTFFGLLTHLGEEAAFIAIALFLYWCFSKKLGIRMLLACFFTMLLNTVIKILVRIPRPWVLDPSFLIVEAARAEATGYSFPSGHTQLIVAITLTTLLGVKNKAVKAVAAALLVLVPFSRMYLGVHTPADVLAGAVFSAIIVLLIHLVLRDPEKEYRRTLGLLAAGTVILAIFAALMPLMHLELVADPENLHDAIKTICLLLGCCIGFFAGLLLERHKVNFTEKSVWWVQLIKLAAGLAIVMAIRAGMKALLGASYPVDALRYGLLCFTAAALWPMVFPALNRLSDKK